MQRKSSPAVVKSYHERITGKSWSSLKSQQNGSRETHKIQMPMLGKDFMNRILLQGVEEANNRDL